MADTFQHRGGILTKRRVIYLLAAVFAVTAGVAWFTQARLLILAGNSLSNGSLRIAGASGTMASGLHLYGISFRTRKLHGDVAEIFLRPSVRGLLAGKAVLTEMRIKTPRVYMNSDGKSGNGKLPWLPRISLADISDGTFQAGRARLYGISCKLSHASGRITIQACSGQYADASASFSGEYYGMEAAARGSLNYPARKVTVDFDYTLSGTRQLISARGSVSGAPLKLKGEIDGKAWKTELLLKDKLPLDAVKPSLKPVKISSASVFAHGTGFSLETVAAKGNFSIAVKPGTTAGGDLAFRKNHSYLHAAYAHGNMSGSLDAEARQGAISGELQASGGMDFPAQGGQALSLHEVKASCTLGGRVESVSAACEGETGAIRKGNFSSAGAKFSGSVAAGGHGISIIHLAISSPAVGEMRLDSAAVSAEGSLLRNDLSIELFHQADSARISGESSLKNGAWRTTLKEFHATRVPDWRFCSQAEVTYSADKGVGISGLCLASGKSRLSFSGVFKTYFPEVMHAAVSGFEISDIEKAGFTQLQLGGLINGSADYPGADDESGTFSIAAEGIALEEVSLGTVAAHGTFGPGAARLTDARWSIYGGEVLASGWATVSNGRTEADFSVKASSMNVSPLLVFLPGASTEGIWADGESRLSLSNDILKTSGAMNLFSAHLVLPGLGLEMDNINARLESGDSSSARISASADKKAGKVNAAGTVSAAGPSVRIRSSAMPFSHQSGLSGEASVDLLLSGQWKEPEISGTVDLNEAGLEMEEWKKFQPHTAKSRLGEAMSMDLKITAERNAWYRDGASAVEIKGNLLLKKEHYHPLIALGTIEALKGYYVYLSNTFDISSGRITFTGENPPNPVIEMSATREVRGEPITIFFNASGKAKSPQVLLSSDPPMEQRDIISFLVTGKPLYKQSTNNADEKPQGRTGDNTAQNLAASYLSQKAASTIGRKLEIDVINVKVNSESQPDVTVGRYMTKNLFISYGQALGQGGEKRVSAEYSLSKHWSLEGKNSSDGRYVADLLFKFGIR